MGELTLNLVAISIFCVTMAALLGPMVHLSPVVPTVAIAALLSLVTLDQGIGNGTLGNLVVGLFSQFTPAQRQRVLHHEAGHFLVAYLLRVPIQDYALTPWQAWRKGLPGQGGIQFDTSPLDPHLSQGTLPAPLLNHYSQVWMAGIAAEEWLHGTAIGGQSDRQTLRFLWTRLGRPPQTLPPHQRWATRQARTLLEGHEEAYQALLTALDSQTPVSDCLALLDRHCPLPAPCHHGAP